MRGLLFWDGLVGFWEGFLGLWVVGCKCCNGMLGFGGVRIGLWFLAEGVGGYLLASCAGLVWVGLLHKIVAYVWGV